MDDLISREAAIDAVYYKPSHKMAIEVLKQVPAVDAVPVVRCGDCKHRDPEDKKCDYGGMAVQGLFFPRPDNWFCADGERRDDNGEDA